MGMPDVIYLVRSWLVTRPQQCCSKKSWRSMTSWVIFMLRILTSKGSVKSNSSKGKIMFVLHYACDLHPEWKKGKFGMTTLAHRTNFTWKEIDCSWSTDYLLEHMQMHMFLRVYLWLLIYFVLICCSTSFPAKGVFPMLKDTSRLHCFCISPFLPAHVALYLFLSSGLRTNRDCRFR